MNLNPENTAELIASWLDLFSFFLMTPEIIGEEKLDELVKSYVQWVLSTGMFKITGITLALGVVVFLPSFYLGYPDFLNAALLWIRGGLLVVVLAPALLLLVFASIRSYAPRGAPRRQWLILGAILFVAARLVKMGAALGMG